VIKDSKNAAPSGVNFVIVGSWWSSPSKVRLSGSVCTYCRSVLRCIIARSNVKKELPAL